MNLNKHSKVRAVGLSCFSALALLMGLAVFCPFDQGEETHAATISKSATFNIDFVLQKVQATTINIDFLLQPMISIGVNGLQDVTVSNATPTGNAVFGQTDFSVTSNSSNGYGIYIYSQDTTNLVGSNGNADVIPTLTADAANGNIPAGFWGYNLSAAASAGSIETLTYSPIKGSKEAATPVNGTITIPNGSSEGSDNYKLSFGAKVGWDQKADTYTNTVKLQVIANATDATALSEYNDLRNEIIDQQEADAAEQAADAETSENIETE